MDKPGSKPSTDARELFGRLIREAIKRSGMTPTEVAKASGLTKTWVYRAMKGDRNLTCDLIGSIFEACGTSLSDSVAETSYGKNRSLHNDLETLLNAGGMHAVTARRLLQGMIIMHNQEKSEKSKE